MILRLKRVIMAPTFTLGVLYVNGAKECDTLEDTDRKLEDGGAKVKGETCIPRGNYDIEITHSPRFKRMLPLLKDVPYFEGIRIHPGNTEKDTEGCILVGVANDIKNKVLMSRTVFDGLFLRMMKAQEAGEPISIEVS